MVQNKELFGFKWKKEKIIRVKLIIYSLNQFFFLKKLGEKCQTLKIFLIQSEWNLSDKSGFSKMFIKMHN